MSDLGFYALRLALGVATLGLVAGVAAGVTQRSDWAEVARRATLIQFALLCLALLSLFVAFYRLDFELAYVATNAARSMPLPYRLAALWGGQAGSLLLWCWMLAAYSAAAVTVNRRNTRLLPWVSAMLCGNVLFFLLLLNFVANSNPFETLPPQAVMSDGSGLNPLLQHPVMLIHPLMLYTGLTGFAVPFAFAFAAMASNELGSDWLRITRRWTLFAWCFLSIGILLGGRWAYEVLGWGGYWAWDPVENASLMPWIAATAYLHSVMVQEKRDMLKIWNLLLIGLTYTLCLFGTMLTRSGLVRSVHAFAQTEIFGQLFLGYLLLVAALFFGLLVWRSPRLRAQNQLESVLSREAGFLVNNWLFMALLGVVLTGTMFPKLSEWLEGVERSVGPAFFNLLGAPIGLALLLLTGVAPLFAWRRATKARLLGQLLWPTISFVVAAATLSFVLRERFAWLAILTWSLGVFVTTTIIQEYARALRARMRHGEGPARAIANLFRKNQRRYGGYIVHLGMVFLFVGFAGAAFNQELLENLRVGESLSHGDYRLEYRSARAIEAQHYGGAEARLALFEAGEPRAIMRPERRVYWLEEQPVSIPSIFSTLMEDLYLVLTAVEADGSATFKLYRNPLVNWIWIGGLTFVLGTLLVMWPFRAGRAGGGASAPPSAF